MPANKSFIIVLVVRVKSGGKAESESGLITGSICGLFLVNYGPPVKLVKSHYTVQYLNYPYHIISSALALLYQALLRMHAQCFKL